MSGILDKWKFSKTCLTEIINRTYSKQKLFLLILSDGTMYIINNISDEIYFPKIFIFIKYVYTTLAAPFKYNLYECVLISYIKARERMKPIAD